MMTFEAATKLFRADRLNELATDPDGLRYLKLRSLSRRESIKVLFEEAKTVPQATKAAQMFREAFDLRISDTLIDEVIRMLYSEGRTARHAREPELVSEL
jgi:hypothetical protein